MNFKNHILVGSSVAHNLVRFALYSISILCDDAHIPDCISL